MQDEITADKYYIGQDKCIIGENEPVTQEIGVVSIPGGPDKLSVKIKHGCFSHEIPMFSISVCCKGDKYIASMNCNESKVTVYARHYKSMEEFVSQLVVNVEERIMLQKHSVRNGAYIKASGK